MARQASFLTRSQPATEASHSAKSPFSLLSGHALTGLFVLLSVLMLMMASQANASSRSLRLSNAHTKETATITYKRNGKFDADGLRKLNQFLRDWRRNEKTEMDPALFDLIWEVYKKTGAKQPITVFSGYRSPATNGMLRSRSKGVAKNSRHTMGQAMDFYLPGVPLATIRRVGLQMQAGGVGYYPGSRFIHIDTGNVRHWPRMTRKQLAKVFPDGVTVHVPTDGKPFSGYKQAKIQVDKRKAEMARSTRSVRRFTQYASAAPAAPKKNLTRTQVASLARKEEESKGGLLQTLLRQTPKEPPKPQFSNDEPLSDSDPEAVADELLEESPSAQALLLPQSLSTLPRVRLVESTTINLAQAEPTAEANADAAIDQTSAESDQTPDSAPIQFASLPRTRPDTLFGVRYQLASAETAPLPAEQQMDAQQTDNTVSTNAPSGIVTEEPAQESGSSPAEAPEQVQMASLPRARTQLSPQPQADATRVAALPQQQAQTQNSKAVLAQMVGSKEEPTPNRFAYASAGNTFLSTLPSDSPRENTNKSGPAQAIEQQQASLASALDAAPLPEPRAQVSRSDATPSDDESDQLARLTFAYGPSGMAHFAHIKQPTSTATFARLSRPTPNNLRALVYKPHSMINQGFGHQLAHRLDDMHFEGPAIARLAVRRFN
ncbi:Uncharacterized conserved protein YcbK, DUF882 family [Cohaesibacter marisflavi]|uniref:Murein endopeptidase K n=1 Tax=Cohaesibacter marisflavi TaxID=655353 RepID=A0A1I5HNG4_9HYPH|nr:DUF882 domain-containing protein [Cohaesibacter marisflavi]SFO49858.1 Uncharacterized conserved protein YcbK, DUF882 family [Cohaesibacter marisflavi]